MVEIYFFVCLPESKCDQSQLETIEQALEIISNNNLIFQKMHNNLKK